MLLTTTRVLQTRELNEVLVAKAPIRLSYFYKIAFEFNRWKHEMLVAIERQKKLDIKVAPEPATPVQPPPSSITRFFDIRARLLTQPLQGDYTKIKIGNIVTATTKKYAGEKTYLEFKQKVDADAVQWKSALGLSPRATWTRQRASYEYFNSQDPFLSLLGNKAVSYMLEQDMRVDDILLFTEKK